ncbi:MAG: PIN domain-containing protein [Gammaproteobacteria bacterium]
MIAFADTSGLYALLARNDQFHTAAAAAFARLAEAQARLITTSYALVETLALLQHRIGLDATKAFQARLQPLLEVVWVDAA